MQVIVKEQPKYQNFHMRFRVISATHTNIRVGDPTSLVIGI